MTTTETSTDEVFFQEVHVKHQGEISVGHLMSRAMNQIHLDLVRVTNARQLCPIGVSFPGYQTEKNSKTDSLSNEFALRLPPIGDRIRLFSRSASELEMLGLQRSLSRLTDYMNIGEIQQIRRKIFGWSTFQRYQPNGSVDKLIRRRMKRQGTSQEEAEQYFAGMKPNASNLPYLDMVSHSSKQRYRLYVERRPNTQGMGEGWGFSTYGLSASVGVPDF